MKPNVFREANMKSIIVLATAICVAIAAPVAAQTAVDPHGHGGPPAAGAKPGPGPTGPRAGMMGGKGMGMMQDGGMRAMQMAPGKHLEGRLAFLRAEIGITDAQASGWNTFADAVRKASKDMMASMPMMGQKPADGGWLANLERHEKMMASHLESLRAIRTAAQPLYASLSDDQKRIADELMAGPMGPMGGMGRMMRM
jgi:hypothetical protein